MNTQQRVRRSLWITLMAFAPFVLMLSAASTARPVAVDTLYAMPPADGLSKHFTGQITQVWPEKVVVEDAVGTNHTFPVADDATIMLDDAEASLDMLLAGMLATVNAKSRGGQWVAKSIHAKKQY